MRILCIGTTENGGAGVAMRRLADSLRSAGAAVEVLSLQRGNERSRDFGEPLPQLQLSKRLQTQIRRGLRESRTSLTNTIFTFDWPAWDVTSHPSVVEADVINLHWITGFLNPALIRRLIDTGKPVVWTLHDQRPFTGGCHYTAGCEAFASHCDDCPQLHESVRHIASRLLREAREQLHQCPLTFVTPSRWLGEQLRRSSIFNDSTHRHRVIPYGIDLTRFFPQCSKSELRARFNLPAEGLAIVVGSFSLDETRKGFAHARIALERLARRLQAEGHAGPPPFVITFGHGMPTVTGIACHHLGSQNEEGVIAVLNSADIFFTMTREDNLPNTVMEAIACGVPVLGTNVGGVPDMISDGEEGWLVARDDAWAAADVLHDLVKHPNHLHKISAAARRKAQDCFSGMLQAQRYLELFEELVSRKYTSASSLPACVLPLPMERLTPAMRDLIAPQTRFRSVHRALRRLFGRL